MGTYHVGVGTGAQLPAYSRGFIKPDRGARERGQREEFRREKGASWQKSPEDPVLVAHMRSLGGGAWSLRNRQNLASGTEHDADPEVGPKSDRGRRGIPGPRDRARPGTWGPRLAAGPGGSPQPAVGARHPIL